MWCTDTALGSRVCECVTPSAVLVFAIVLQAYLPVDGLIGIHIPLPLAAKRITLGGKDYIECEWLDLQTLLAPHPCAQ